MTESHIRENYKSGDFFKGTIDGKQTEGKIFIGCEKGEERIRVFFCTNEESLDGSTAEDKLGYEYSWVYENVDDIEITPGDTVRNNYSIF